MIGVEDEDEDTDIDKATKRTPSKPVLLSPAEEQREQIRIKRLIKLDHTGQELFEVGDMIKVDKIGYGVIKWIGEIAGKLSAGIEFVSRIRIKANNKGFLHVKESRVCSFIH